MKHNLILAKEPKVLHEYINGNTRVTIYDDGTKIRETDDDEFSPIFPENIDVKITDCCKWGCPFCHENSTPEGRHGDIFHPIFDSLVRGTELAIGGGNIFEHPNIEDFLLRLKDRGIVSNITVNQKDFYFESRITKINEWMKNRLVYGVGLSWDGSDLRDILKKIHCTENIVVHTIAGVHDIEKLANIHRIKILILGYKNLRRGVEYKKSHGVERKVEELKKNISELMKKFGVVSFDNLALEQLDIQKIISKEDWDSYYMGDDGTHTMYIDLPNNQFASSSTSSIRYDMSNESDIKNIFNIIRKEKY